MGLRMDKGEWNGRSKGGRATMRLYRVLSRELADRKQLGVFVGSCKREGAVRREVKRREVQGERTEMQLLKKYRDTLKRGLHRAKVRHDDCTRQERWG
jgi:hypothetical protein